MSLAKKLQDTAMAATMTERHRILKICQGLIDEARSHPGPNAPVVMQTLMLVVKNVKSGMIPKETKHDDPFTF